MTVSTSSQKTYLFTDVRHIRCGDLGWFSPEGNGLSVPVHWGGQSDIGVKEGEKVALLFQLWAAELLGFEWV